MPSARMFRTRAFRCCLMHLLAAASAMAQPQRTHPAPATVHWTGTWAASPCAPPAATERIQKPGFHDETLRLIVHTSIGGDAVRIRLSNTFATEPLTVGAAHLALRESGGTIKGGTDRALTFSGRAFVTIPGGASVLSEPLPEAIPALADVAVSLYLPGDTLPGAIHYGAQQTSYVAAGNQVQAGSLNAARTLTQWPLLTAVEVSSRTAQGAIVTLGSSTTDGAHSTMDTNHRWPDFMARRLQGDAGLRTFGVLNEGIGGNRVLHDGRGPNASAFGPSASARFDRDVLAQAGVRYVVVFEGGNDINHPGDSAPLSETVTADDMIAGYRQLIARGHEHGLRVILGTITPFGGSVKPDVQPAREAKRSAVNHWILTGNEADGTVDFSHAVADPAHPERIAAQFDSGDHLHPNDAGYEAMAGALDLRLFR